MMKTTNFDFVLWRNLEHKELWEGEGFESVTSGDAEYTLVTPHQLLCEMNNADLNLQDLQPLTDELTEVMNANLLIGLDG